jgi:uncharacterized protein YndB with AHSA1/START domain
MGSDLPRVLVATRVPCEPAEAFTRFTAEIGEWWQPNDLFQFSEGRTGTLAFESREGGRLIETYDDGTAFVVGVIRTWAPPRLLVLSWRYASFSPDLSTELHVIFEPTGPGQTRVTVEHYGWEAIPSDHASRHNFPVATFQLRFAEWWRSLLWTAFPPG